TYDRMHNRLTESKVVNGGAPTVKTLTYNAANQISTAGYTYDNNGNLTSDGVNTHIWDRANRLLAMGGSTYNYEGGGNRIQQVQGGNTSKYLLDLNSGLPTMLVETIGANVTRFVHGLRGLHQIKTAAGAWEHILPDALGSLRVVTDNAVAVLESRNYGVYGDVFGTTGTSQTQYGYTGEPTDGNGLVYDRARYLSPALGQFVSLDPKETFNRYAYTDGNPVMRIDSDGMMMMYAEGGGSNKPYHPVAVTKIQVNAVAHILVNTFTTVAQAVSLIASPILRQSPTANAKSIKNISDSAHTVLGGSYPWQEKGKVQTAYNQVVFGGLNRINNNTDANRIVGVLSASVQNGKLTTSNKDNKTTLNLVPQMENVFGYKINYGGINGETLDPQSESGKVLTFNLFDASLQIAGYLQGKGRVNTQRNGRLGDSSFDTFQRVFGTLSDEIDPTTQRPYPVNIYLGADKSVRNGTTRQGLTPRIGDVDVDKMFLGSDMQTQDVIHEFGHQLDRRFGSALSEDAAAYMNGRNYGRLKPESLDYRASAVPDESEYFADYFMTSVLSGRNYASTDATCTQSPCPIKTVQFLGTDKYPANRIKGDFDNFIAQNTHI
ncbi:MAG: RHS repeat-associated core domain-containing protein, partial [Chloroflexota bacterium]